MRVQIAQIPAAIQSGFDQAVADGTYSNVIPKDSLPALREGLAMAFDSQAMEQSIVDQLSRTLDQKTLVSILDWHKSQLGLKVHEAEIAHSVFSDASEREQFLARLDDEPVSAERMSALYNLEQAWRIVESSVDMMIEMQIAVTAALMHLAPEAERVPVDRLVEVYAAQKPALTSHFSQETLLSMIYIYQDLSLDEIGIYESFALSETGQRYVDSTNLALHRSMLEASLRFGKTMGRLMHHESASADI